MRKFLISAFLLVFLFGCNELLHVTAEEFKWQYSNRNMQSVYWADYLGEKDGKVYLLRKRAPLIGSKWKEEVLFTEVNGLDADFLKILREQERHPDPKGKDHTQQKSPSVDILKKTIESLNLNDPTKDVEKRIANNDMRFVGINGYTCYAPGVEKDDITLTQKHGMRCLEGTSDYIENEEHGRLIQTAIKYAKEYNLNLLMKFKTKQGN
jgi:hypothetical protein